ncbi:SAM-dependent methyltransferase [Nocardiopsis trehalosi]|uniref:SAM-dependent methyltransferase n=1 Tax=Nocardiopsis trehalosi TaxID=109329 RepID=UPI00082A4650|nr:SAM-dependent methyltransferase [Nocardiopsis trehalosi]
MTDEWRALHIGEEPLVDIPNPRVIHIGDRRARPRSEPRTAEGRRAEARRGFLRRVVAYLAADTRIRQFVDLGSRLPAGDGIADTARAHAPDARVVYVDTDATRALHAPAQAGGGAVPVVTAPSLRPAALLDRLADRGVIDFTAPVAVLLTDTAPLRRDGVLPHDLVRALHTALPGGSHIAVAQRVAPDGDTTADAHSRELAAAVLEPFTLIEPGLADIAWWPYPDEEVTAEGTGILAGVGRKDTDHPAGPGGRPGPARGST